MPIYGHTFRTADCPGPIPPTIARTSLPVAVTRRMIAPPGANRLPSARGVCMKLVRFGPRGREKPGIIDSKGGIRDLSKVVPDIAADALSPKGLAKIRKAAIDKLPLVRGNPRLGPCVGGVANFIAIGLNYSDHAAETNSPI